MSREREGFRDNLALLNERFPDRDMLTITDVAAWMGVSMQTVKRLVRFNEQTRRVSKADLARQVSV